MEKEPQEQEANNEEAKGVDYQHDVPVHVLREIVESLEEGQYIFLQCYQNARDSSVVNAVGPSQHVVVLKFIEDEYLATREIAILNK